MLLLLNAGQTGDSGIERPGGRQNMDYGFAFLSAVDIYKDVALAE